MYPSSRECNAPFLCGFAYRERDRCFLSAFGGIGIDGNLPNDAIERCQPNGGTSKTRLRDCVAAYADCQTECQLTHWAWLFAKSRPGSFNRTKRPHFSCHLFGGLTLAERRRRVLLRRRRGDTPSSPSSPTVMRVGAVSITPAGVSTNPSFDGFGKLGRLPPGQRNSRRPRRLQELVASHSREFGISPRLLRRRVISFENGAVTSRNISSKSDQWSSARSFRS